MNCHSSVATPLFGQIKSVGRVLALLLSVSSFSVAVADETPEQLARHYGFDSVEIYKIDRNISQLRTADFNNDGAIDIAVANNAKSTIEILLQRGSKPAEPEKPKGVNDLVNPDRFERKKVSLTWQVVCLRAADVTGNKNVDLILTGNPKELVVLPGKGDGSFGEPITRRIPDLLPIPTGMEIADLNADGRLDIVVMGESDMIVYFQNEEGGIGNPTRYAHSINGPLMLSTADINGDGLTDLAVLCNDTSYPLQVQFQSPDGQLGPMHRVKLPPLRNLVFASCLDRKQQDLFGIERISGRLKRWVPESGTELKAEDKWSVQVYPLLGKSTAEQLPLAIGDLTGDGLPDVVSANVDAAQLLLFVQKAGGGLGLPEKFGGQIALKDMCCFDADKDGIDELYVLSPQEETIACSTYDGDRLTFPKPIPCEDTPQALSFTRDADGKALLAYVSKDKNSKYRLIVKPIDATSSEDSRIIRTELTGLEDAPTAIRWADANQDGRDDLLIFLPFGSLRAAIQQSDGTFKLLATTGQAQAGLVKDAKPSGFAYADTNGDGNRDIILTQKAFVRALRINKADAWEVIDQYNAPTNDAELTGVCVRPVPGRDRPDLVMYDRRNQEVHNYVPSGDDTYVLDRSVQVGAMDLKAMLAAPLDGSGNQSILLADKKRLVVVLPEVPAMRMTEAGAYESSIEQAWLRQIAVGDLNNDGRTDLAVTDTKEHMVEILTFGGEDKLVRATKFRLFARKQHETAEQEKGEPHWVAMADVTNDGKEDLLFIAHDRILLYPAQ